MRKPEGNRLLGIYTCIKWNNIKMDIQKVNGAWIGLIGLRTGEMADTSCSIKCGEFLYCLKTSKLCSIVLVS
jgi:hypothetical protein